MNFTLIKLFLRILFLLVLPVFSTGSYGQFFGRCIDAQTGRAISGATIQHSGEIIAISEPSGHFSFQGDSSIRVIVEHPDYKSMREHISPNRELFFLLTPSEHNIDEITVSAPLLNYRSRKVPAGFSLITADSIQPNLSAIEILEQSPGVFMQKGALNTGRIMIRGIGSRSPYATTRIRAYLDDIPLTSGDGNTTVEDLEMSNIARTEIVRGPASALYGSGLGGVIIFHPDHTQTTPFSAETVMQYGPFDGTKALVNTGLRRNRSIVKANIAHTQTDGFRENSNYNRWNGQLLFRHHFKNHALFFLTNYTRLNAQIPSSINESDYRDSPHKAAANWLAVSGYEKYDKWLSGLTLKSDFNNSTNKISVFLNHINAYESRPFNILDDRMLTYGFRDEFSINIGQSRLTSGVEVFNERYDWQLIETDEGTPGELFSDNLETRFFVNIFAKADFSLTNKWQLTAGGNLHFLKFQLTDNFSDDEDISGNYRYNPVFSPRLGITGDLTTKITVYGSGGHGFSPPSVEETLLPEGYINPNLQPEEGWNYDAGIRGNLLNNRLNFDITAYYVALNNLLVTKRETEEIFYGINAGRTNHYGIESMLNMKIISGLSPWSATLNINHTWMKNKFKTFIDDDTNYSGNQLPGVPEQYLRSGLKIGYKDLTHLQLTWKHSGSLFLDDANTKKYGGHDVFDLSLSRRIHTGNSSYASLQGGINNLFNQHYAAMVLVNAPSFGNSLPRYYYPGAPVNAYLRLTFNFTTG